MRALYRHIEAQPPVNSGERSFDNPELFISTESVQRLVTMAMEGRIDQETGALMPLEEERILTNGPDYTMKPLPSTQRYDMVLPEQPQTLPYKDGGKLAISQYYNISDAIYQGLANQHSLRLGAAGVERLTYEQAKLEEALVDRPDLAWARREDQMQDAYHIAQKDKPAIGGDGQLISPVRVYVPGGEHGVQIAKRMLEADVDFASAKIWVPQATAGRQDFRQDAPIFTAHTADQLHSVADALRTATLQSILPTGIESPLGVPIEGVPGAFAAQLTENQSFNGEMANFWAEPIREACNSLPLHAGDIVTPEWIGEASLRAAAIAQQQAQAAGIRPVHHALVAEQNMDVIIDALRP
jgi:hypothetical protein